MENTPQVSRLHIALIGLRNAGKSSLLNAWVGQDVAIVSDVAGTTTDTVRKPIELPGLGACLLLDTPGFDDTDRQLGQLRIDRMQASVKQADIVVMVASGPILTEEEREWTDLLKRKGTPWMVVLAKADLLRDALNAGALTIDDLYTDEETVITRLLAVPALAARWQDYRRITGTVSTAHRPEGVYAVRVAAKKRSIDPLVRTGSGLRRYTALSATYAAQLAAFRADGFDRWVQAVYESP